MIDVDTPLTDIIERRQDEKTPERGARRWAAGCFQHPEGAEHLHSLPWWGRVH